MINKPDVSLNNFNQGILDRKINPGLTHMRFCNNLIVGEDHLLKLRKGSRVKSSDLQSPIVKLLSFDDLFLMRFTSNEMKVSVRDEVSSVKDPGGKLWNENGGAVSVGQFRDHFFLTNTERRIPRKVIFDKGQARTKPFIDISSAGLPKPQVEFVPKDGVIDQTGIEDLPDEPDVSIGSDPQNFVTNLRDVNYEDQNKNMRPGVQFGDVAGTYFGKSLPPNIVSLDRFKIDRGSIYNSGDGVVYGWSSEGLADTDNDWNLTIRIGENDHRENLDESDWEDNDRRDNGDFEEASARQRTHGLPPGLLGVWFWESRASSDAERRFWMGIFSNSDETIDWSKTRLHPDENNEVLGLVGGVQEEQIAVRLFLLEDSEDRTGDIELQFFRRDGSLYTEEYDLSDDEESSIYGAEVSGDFAEEGKSLVAEGFIGYSGQDIPYGSSSDDSSIKIGYGNSEINFSISSANLRASPSINKFSLFVKVGENGIGYEAKLFINGQEIRNVSSAQADLKTNEINGLKFESTSTKIGFRDINIYAKSEMIEADVLALSEAQDGVLQLNTYNLGFVYRKRYDVEEISELGVENKETDFVDISSPQEFAIRAVRNELVQFKVKGFRDVIEAQDLFDKSRLMLEVYVSSFGDPTIKKIQTLDLQDAESTVDVTLPAKKFEGEVYLYGAETPFRDRPPKSKYVHIVNGTAFYGNIDGSPNEVRQSLPNNPDGVPENFRAILDEEIVGISSSRGIPIVFCKNKVYALTRTFDSAGRGTLFAKEIDASARCVSHNSLVKYKDAVVFLGERGIYFTDGNTVTFLTNQCNDFLTRNFIKRAMESEERELVSGAYVQLDNKIYWSFPFEEGLKGIVADLQFGFGRTLPVTTFGEDLGQIRWNSIVEHQSTLFRGDHLGNVFEQTSEEKTDPIPIKGIPSEDWRRRDISWDLKTNDLKLGEASKSVHIHSLTANFLGEGAIRVKPYVIGNCQVDFNLREIDRKKVATRGVMNGFQSARSGIFGRNVKLPKFVGFAKSIGAGLKSLEKSSNELRSMSNDAKIPRRELLRMDSDGYVVFRIPNDISEQVDKNLANTLVLKLSDGTFRYLDILRVDENRGEKLIFCETRNKQPLEGESFLDWTIYNLHTASNFSIIDVGFLMDEIKVEATPDGAKG